MLIAVFLLPPSAAYKKILFYSLIDKNLLLKETKTPRIIFIGGSNVSFGLNSQLVNDSLALNPINMGVNASHGLKYMLASSIGYIHENDVVVVILEYQHFFDTYGNGEIELLSVIIDVVPQTLGFLDCKQWYKLTRFVPEYSYSKIKNFIIPEITDTLIGVYDRKSFNLYGDVFKHWSLSGEKAEPQGFIKSKMDKDIFRALIKYREMVYNKKAKIYISFPSYQDISFNRNITQIKKVEAELKAYDFILLSTAERYKINDSLIYGKPYHLTKRDVDIRTNLLIEDLKRVIQIKN